MGHAKSFPAMSQYLRVPSQVASTPVEMVPDSWLYPTKNVVKRRAFCGGWVVVVVVVVVGGV